MVACGFSCPLACGIFPDQDQTHVPCIGRRIFNHWITREVFILIIFKIISLEYSLEGLMLKLKLQYLGHLMGRPDSLEKTLVLGKIEGKGEKGTTEDKMVGWHHRLSGHEFE